MAYRPSSTVGKGWSGQLFRGSEDHVFDGFQYQVVSVEYVFFLRFEIRI